MKTPLTIAAIGNLIDTVSTLYLNGQGYTEANPFMSALLPYPVLFATVKIGAMALALWILWRNRDSQIARKIAWFAAGLYGLIAVYYIFFFTILL
jgi:hypothetical protein